MDRRAGILAHLTSLPTTVDGRPDTQSFLTWLRRSGFASWQILPVGPVHHHRSPYASPSSFAGDLSLIDRRDDRPPGPRRLAQFARSTQQRPWLEDWVLYAALRGKLRRPWYRWPVALRRRQPAALRDAMVSLRDSIDLERRIQCRFADGWSRFRRRAARADIELVGDLPFYPALDSADVWGRPNLFHMDADGTIELEAGVPPDYFSRRGQRWQAPLYRWEADDRSNESLWQARIDTQLRRFDRLRLDHFRGYVATWGFDRTGRGRWISAPGSRLLGSLPPAQSRRLFAEDLGVITPAVHRLRETHGLAGTRVLQFAYDSSRSIHHPSRHPRNAVAYTGTHDNDTLLGWFRGLRGEVRTRAHADLGTQPREATERAIRLALDSAAEDVFIPLQDLWALGSETRMNRPGTKHGNWRWRADASSLDDATARRVRGWLRQSGRARAD